MDQSLKCIRVYCTVWGMHKCTCDDCEWKRNIICAQMYNCNEIEISTLGLIKSMPSEQGRISNVN